MCAPPGVSWIGSDRLIAHSLTPHTARPPHPQILVVTQNAESVQQVLAQKEQSLRMVTQFMQMRLMSMSQQGRKP